MASFLGMRYATPVRFEGERWERIADTLTLVRQTLTNGAHRWQVDLSLEPDVDGALAAGGKLQAHREEHGHATAFTVEMPQHLGVPEPVDAAGDAEPVALAAAATAADLTLEVDAAEDCTVHTGRFFTVAGHTKVYMVIEDLALVGGAAGTLRIVPALQESAADDAVLDFSPDIRVKYRVGAPRSESYTDGVLYRATLALEEAP